MDFLLRICVCETFIYYSLVTNYKLELIIFCNPMQAYSRKLEQDVARDYTQMAIDDYDKLIHFDEKYMSFVETPDYQSITGQKNGRNLLLSLFANQPIIRVGDIDNRFQSSSYLFNPESNDEKLLLPDLDIVQIEGIYQVRDAANIIEQFYEQYGWQVYIFDGKITDKKEISPNSNRFNQSIQMINPEVLREIAKEKVNYSLTDLCF